MSRVLSRVCCYWYSLYHVFHHIYSCFFFFFKQKTAYEMRISDWSSDVCSSDLLFSQHDEAQRLQQRIAGDVLDEIAVGAGLQAGGEMPRREAFGQDHEQIGRASCRERVCQYV